MVGVVEKYIIIISPKSGQSILQNQVPEFLLYFWKQQEEDSFHDHAVD
jgi:hypothetical protein